ncbi:MAG: 3-isopropylmalate dehydratase small subunit [Burkholderiales bacterium PBB3]|jgi:3-isopropylmalate/(R)-2-methylmalate dehydratase small subunit|nr:MAG: 3-isopropylmalate dehydratase small subunit [Burkholderiales bacterium PBB3]
MDNNTHLIQGRAAAIRIENLDTDQIIPKQFLRGIDKTGLADGILYDLRFDEQGVVRPDFVLNRPEYSGVNILIGGSNFGCGSSREHAVWGLQQYGIQAVIAPSFGEIFYSNAMNNRLILVMLSQSQIDVLIANTEHPNTNDVRIDVQQLRVQSRNVDAPFAISSRHQQMYLDNLDVIGLSLTHQKKIDDFSTRHWSLHPWMQDVAGKTRTRLDQRSKQA